MWPFVRVVLHEYQNQPPPAENESVALALHGCVLALLAHRRCEQAVQAAKEASVVPPALEAAVHVVCALCGMSDTDISQRSALQMAKHHPVACEEADVDLERMEGQVRRLHERYQQHE